MNPFCDRRCPALVGSRITHLPMTVSSQLPKTCLWTDDLRSLNECWVVPPPEYRRLDSLRWVSVDDSPVRMIPGYLPKDLHTRSSWLAIDNHPPMSCFQETTSAKTWGRMEATGHIGGTERDPCSVTGSQDIRTSFSMDRDVIQR